MPPEIFHTLEASKAALMQEEEILELQLWLQICSEEGANLFNTIYQPVRPQSEWLASIEELTRCQLNSSEEKQSHDIVGCRQTVVI